MNIVNERVKHILFGEGKVKACGTEGEIAAEKQGSKVKKRLLPYLK